MPIHDWSAVHPEIFHGFHLSWVVKVAEALNTGGLPEGFYAELEPAEQHVVEVFDPLPPPTVPSNRIRLPPDTFRRTAERGNSAVQRQRRVVVRYTRGHRLTSVVGFVTPRNAQNRPAALQFLTRCRMLIQAGVHRTVLNIVPPNRVTPRGLIPDLWRKCDRVPLVAPAGRPACVASARACDRPQGYFKLLAFGDERPPFPLFLTEALSVHLPLADTYATAFAASPPYLREELSTPAPTGA